MSHKLVTLQQSSHDEIVGVSSAMVDVVSPRPIKTISHPLSATWTFVSSQETPAFGKTINFYLPLAEFVGDPICEFDLVAQSAGNYTTYVGLSMMKEVIIQTDTSSKIHEYDPVTVYQSILETMPQDERNMVLNAAGGSAHNAGIVSVPIPCFFGKFANRQQPPPPLYTGALNSAIKISITLRSAADAADAGAAGDGTINDVKLYFKTFNIHDSQRASFGNVRGVWSYHAQDWETQIDNSVLAATALSAQKINLDGFTGQIVKLNLYGKSTANKVTAKDRFLLSPLNKIELKYDNSKIVQDWDSTNTLNLFSYLDNGTLDDASFDVGTTVTFGYPDHQNFNTANLGHLNVTGRSTLDLFVDASADGVVDVLSTRLVEYKIHANGSLRKIESID